MAKIIATLIAIAWFSNAAQGQFPGDECAQALIAVNGPQFFSTIGATSSTPEPDESY